MSLGLKMHACASAPAGGSARAATTRTPERSISAFRAISAHGPNARSLSSGTTGSVLRGSSTLPPPARLTSCRSESSRRARGALRVFAGAVSPGETVLVVGATGGVGQLVTAKLIEKGYKVKVAVRSKEKAALLFGDAVEAVIADTRSPEGLPALLEGKDKRVPHHHHLRPNESPSDRIHYTPQAALRCPFMNPLLLPLYSSSSCCCSSSSALMFFAIC